jgi:hypothetical protein
VNLGERHLKRNSEVILPATFDEFYALAATGDMSYRLAWDACFPTLADADGDQLKSSQPSSNEG